MSRVKVESSINVCEQDGEETKGLILPQLVVKSHWNERDKVVLVIGGHEYTVVGSDLGAAITNAENVR